MTRDRRPERDLLADLAGILADESWREVTTALARALAILRDDDYLIVECRHGGYVQAAGGAAVLHAEAMSLGFVLADATLRHDRRLVAALTSEMGELGWALPECGPHDCRPARETRDGKAPVVYDAVPNLLLAWSQPADCDEAARCLVATLRRVYGAALPEDLTYFAFTDAKGRGLVLPELGIRRTARPA